jgi:hypothetical protein
MSLECTPTGVWICCGSTASPGAPSHASLCDGLETPATVSLPHHIQQAISSSNITLRCNNVLYHNAQPRTPPLLSMQFDVFVLRIATPLLMKPSVLGKASLTRLSADLWPGARRSEIMIWWGAAGIASGGQYIAMSSAAHLHGLHHRVESRNDTCCKCSNPRDVVMMSSNSMHSWTKQLTA